MDVGVGVKKRGSQGFHPGQVVSLAPLMVALKGCATPIPAEAASSLTPVVGMVVQLQLRSPLPPMIYITADPLDGGTGTGTGGGGGGGD